MAMPSSAPREPVRLVPSVERATGPLAGDPGMLGLPSFIVGSVALALVDINVLPHATTGGILPILFAATSVGLFLATLWAAVIGQNAAAGIYGIFGGFFLSYAVMLFGIIHNLFGIGLLGLVDTSKLFLISWIVIVTMLVVATIRLPLIFTVLLTLVDAAFVLSLLSIIQNSANLQKAAGWVIMAFCAIGVYLFMSTTFHATGGKELPAGRPILR